MHKKTIGIILSVTIIFIIGIVVWGSKQTKNLSSSAVASNNDQADIIYYFGKECPHCKNVEKFITDNDVDQKLSFAKKEVWHNEQNNQSMQERAKECALDESKVGVPFVYARGKCYVGEIDVENFLKSEIGLK